MAAMIMLLDGTAGNQCRLYAKFLYLLAMGR